MVASMGLYGSCSSSPLVCASALVQGSWICCCLHSQVRSSQSCYRAPQAASLTVLCPNVGDSHAAEEPEVKVAGERCKLQVSEACLELVRARGRLPVAVARQPLSH